YITQMTQQIAQLEVNRQTIIANNPRRGSEVWYKGQLNAIDDQIGALRSKLEVEVEKYKDSRLGSVSNTNDEGKTGTAALGALRRQILDDAITLQTLQARLSAIADKRGEIQAKLSQVPTQELAMQRLERDKGALEKIY